MSGSQWNAQTGQVTHAVVPIENVRVFDDAVGHANVESLLARSSDK